MLSIWDRLFGTFTYEDTNNIRYGIDLIEDESSAENLAFQLRIPFNKNIRLKN